MFLYYFAFPDGLVAQSVEQRIENPCVGGSIPPQATNDLFFEFHCNLARFKKAKQINEFCITPSQKASSGRSGSLIWHPPGYYPKYRGVITTESANNKC